MNEQSKSPSRNLAWTAITAALTALAFLGTMLVRIPIPATTGYFNLGDVFVILAGLWLGPRSGMIVGFLGPTVADLIGYPQFILATAITKGLEGLLVGLVGYGQKAAVWRKGAGAGVGAVVMVAGYFVFEAFVYPALGSFVPFFKVTTVQAAAVELPINLMQGVIGAAVGFGLWKAVSGINPNKKNGEAEEAD